MLCKTFSESVIQVASFAPPIVRNAAAIANRVMPLMRLGYGDDVVFLEPTASNLCNSHSSIERSVSIPLEGLKVVRLTTYI